MNAPSPWIRQTHRPSARWIFITLCCMMALASAVTAQSFVTGQTLSPLPSRGTSSCTATWYNPSLLTLPNGDLGFVAQATRHPGAPCPASNLPLPNIDDLYSARHNSSTGQWILPQPGSCPTLKGGYSRCGFNPNTGPAGPIGNPSVVKVDSTYYMAFSGGNADFITGRIQWATSTDGVNWSVYAAPGETWTPIVQPRYNECGITQHHAEGIAEVKLVYQAGAGPTSGGKGVTGMFYLYFQHYGYNTHQVLDTWVVRIPRDPSRPGHLGTGKEIWHREHNQAGTWKPFESGLMVWDFEVNDGLASVPGEPVLGPYRGRPASQHFRFGSGEVIRHGSHWLHVYNFGDVTYSQTTSSLSGHTWSNPVVVDDTTLRALGPNAPSPPRDVGLHYANLGDRTGLWLFAPIAMSSCSGDNPYRGLEIVPAELCTTSSPTISSVSPNSGSSGGGTTVTVYGTHLDCASSVTFGGAAGTILSRTSTRITVRTPAHGSGPVNVRVTTPGGIATRASGFTYTAPPAYGGYHDSVSCYGITGWAWDANQPNTPIDVDIYKDGSYLTTISANGFRQDLLNAGYGNGYHGFGYSLPASVRDGANHSIEVRFAGTNTALSQSPRNIDCRSLTISKNGNGGGTVTSSPGGIQCGNTCSYWYPRNWTVQLLTSPDSGSQFSAWGGHNDCLDGSVTLSSHRSCTATFSSNTNARLIWIQPQSLANFGPPGSLVMAGRATGAPDGSRVAVSWRNLTTHGNWVTNAYQHQPNPQGIWYSTVPNANTSHQYEVSFTYGGVTWATCTYPGSGGFHACP